MQLRSKISNLKKLLKTRIIAKEIKWFDKVKSTQRCLKEVLKREKKPAQSYLFVSDVQTDGYGRFGRKWFSPEGGLWFTISFKKKFKPEETFLLTPLCALAVSEIIDRYIKENRNKKLKTGIKYPNDIIINSKKVGGCLVETYFKGCRVEWILIGVGINVNNKLPKEIKDISISLKDVFGKEISIIRLLSDILNKLDENIFYFEKKKRYFLEEYYKKCFFRRS